MTPPDNVTSPTSLAADLTRRPPATREAVAATEAALGRRLPAEYVAFMLEHDGAEGTVGAEGYAVLFGIRDLPGVSVFYAALEHLVGRTVFGTDRRGGAFVFDEHGDVLTVGFIAAHQKAVQQGSFAQFVQRLQDGTLASGPGASGTG